MIFRHACLFFNFVFMDKLTKLVLSFFLLLVVVFSLDGCKKKVKESNMTGFEQSMTQKDTAAVTQLVGSFFDNVINGHVDDAVAMLYKTDPNDPYGEPQKLSNEEMKSVAATFNSFPIKSYHVDYIKFDQTYVNEVKVTAIIDSAHDNVPEIKTVFYFKPIDYVDSWKLTLVDSHNNDHNVIDGDHRDSMQSRYASELRGKQRRAIADKEKKE